MILDDKKIINVTSNKNTSLEYPNIYMTKNDKTKNYIIKYPLYDGSYNYGILNNYEMNDILNFINLGFIIFSDYIIHYKETCPTEYKDSLNENLKYIYTSEEDNTKIYSIPIKIVQQCIRENKSFTRVSNKNPNDTTFIIIYFTDCLPVELENFCYKFSGKSYYKIKTSITKDIVKSKKVDIQKKNHIVIPKII